MKNLIFDSVVLETKLYWIGFSTWITNKIGDEKLKFKNKKFFKTKHHNNNILLFLYFKWSYDRRILKSRLFTQECHRFVHNTHKYINLEVFCAKYVRAKTQNLQCRIKRTYTHNIGIQWQILF